MTLARSRLAVVVLLAVAACAHPGAGTGPAAGTDASIVVEDVLPEVLRFLDAHRAEPRDVQRAAFRREVVERHAALLAPVATDRAVERLLVELPRLEPKLRAAAGVLPGEVTRLVRRFEARLPDTAGRNAVAIGLSFGDFQTVWRDVAGRRTLVLGADALAFYRGPYADLGPVLDHALALGALPPGATPAPAWRTVWELGFPRVVVRTLDPESAEAARALPGADGPALAALAARTRAVLDSTREADVRALEGSIRDADGRSAPRGAALSLEVARAVVGGRSLQDAARLDGPALRDALARALDRLARPGS